GAQSGGFADTPAISADGRYVAFVSNASDLVPGGVDGTTNVFVRDTCVGAPGGCMPTTALASVTSGFAGGIAGLCSIMPSGPWVAFARFKSPQGSTAQAFVRDTCAGAPAACTATTVQVSVALDGSAGNNNSQDTAISADGRFMAFSSDAANLAPGDTNNKTDVFLGRTGFNAPSSAASASP